MTSSTSLRNMADRPFFSGAELDTLIALIENGPLSDGDLPSKHGRDLLIKRGLAVRVVMRGQDGFQAATYAGRDAYKAYYSMPDDPSNTLHEAYLNRMARATIRKARSR